jgi:hypothetical protein
MRKGKHREGVEVYAGNHTSVVIAAVFPSWQKAVGWEGENRG